MDQNTFVLQVKNLNKSYGAGAILSDVDLSLMRGEFVAVMGQSGCGKSTLLYCISGMDRADSGQILFDGQDLMQMKEQEMQRLRLLHMGFVFQKTSFLKNLSIMDNIVFPAFQAGKRSRAEITAEAEQRMDTLGIGSIADRDMTEVSGGQLQRAAICRAMINHPDVLFGDELTGALNSSATGEVLSIIGELHRQGTTVFLATHDAKVALRADRVIYLEDGSVKDELRLGAYEEKTAEKRMERMNAWLAEMKF